MYLPLRITPSCLVVAMLLVASITSRCPVEGGSQVMHHPPRPQLKNILMQSAGAARFPLHDNDAFFRVPHRQRRLRHRRGFLGDQSAKRSPRYANHDDPVYLTVKDGEHTLIVTSDGRVDTTKEPNPKDGEILRRVARDERNLTSIVMSNHTSFKAKYYLLAKQTNRFICMNRTGGYYSSEKRAEECKFIVVDHTNSHESYCSAIYTGGKRNPRQNRKRKWCIGIDKNGKLRPRVKPDQERAHFLPKPVITLPTFPLTGPRFLPTTTTSIEKNPKRPGGKRKGKGKGKNRGKNKDRHPKRKKPKCEEETLFARKCIRYRSRRRNANPRGHRRRVRQRRPLEWDKPSFFST